MTGYPGCTLGKIEVNNANTTTTTTTTTTNSVRTPMEVPAEIKGFVNARECILPENQSEVKDSEIMPIVDVFMNPAERENMKMFTKRQQKKADKYFRQSDMLKLYPRLFEILWYTTFPCYDLPGLSKEFMIKSCELAGEKVDCATIFEKVPTDLGICCSFK